MSIRLHRCGNTWLKVSGHPCWRVQRALDEEGVAYEVVSGPWPGRKGRDGVLAGTGQSSYPAIEFEDGSWYRAESKEMERTIRDGRLFEGRRAPETAAPAG